MKLTDTQIERMQNERLDAYQDLAIEGLILSRKQHELIQSMDKMSLSAEERIEHLKAHAKDICE